MHVLVKGQVFKEIVFSKENLPPIENFDIQKLVMSHFWHFWRVFWNVFEKLLPSNTFNLSKKKNDMVIHQYV